MYFETPKVKFKFRFLDFAFLEFLIYARNQQLFFKLHKIQ